MEFDKHEARVCQKLTKYVMAKGKKMTTEAPKHCWIKK